METVNMFLQMKVAFMDWGVAAVMGRGVMCHFF